MKEINLIPGDLLYLIRWNHRRILLTSLLGLTILIFFSWVVISGVSSHYRGVIREDMKKLSAMKQEQAESEELLGRLAAASDDSERLRKAASAVNDFSSGRVHWSDIIGELTAGDFEGMWFQQFRVSAAGENEGKQIEIEGFTLDSGSISRLMAHLEESPRFDRVILREGKADNIAGTPVYGFSVECKVVK
ncbi:MAG: hypothetical protein GF417_07240 [Candidatus Latescibacteria bacterium]|nr:hypothetical protein [bacterium]MBD3424213.1 hypothetical protein [Candidatus Latescibacterota bacterium]